MLGAPAKVSAQAGPAINFTAWSAAVDQVKSHVTAFEKASGLRVNYENFPWAQYRTSVVTRLVGNAPLDVLWVSDAWLPEFAEARWLADISDVPELMKYNAEAAPYCTQSMAYRGKQYGLAYYGDHMSFVVNMDILNRAGIAEAPKTWDEVVQQSLRIKQAGLVEYPMLLSLAIDTWLVEFMSAMVFSHGSRFIDPAGAPIMAEAGRGMIETASWIRDAIHTHKIVSPGAVETPEINGLRAMGAGQHAFGIIPTYRLRALNDPSQATAAGKLRPAMMPMGPRATASATCGWIRFYGMSAGAKANAARRANAVKFMEFFGGRDTTGAYTLQKLLLTDVGLPFCTQPLSADPDVKAFWEKWAGGGDVIARQAEGAVKKDVISPWFGEWNETANAAWQSVFLNRAAPEAAARAMAQKWNELRRG
ncbi:MAG: extracellular solute-binding protein [Alphaproteobacteria bacterium]|jgi:multiple sugar transport system substrate-binding protein